MIPSPEYLERSADAVRRELDAGLEQARALYRELQDVDAEQPEHAPALQWVAALQLRDLDRRMLRALCELIPAEDDRQAAARRLLTEEEAA